MPEPQGWHADTTDRVAALCIVLQNKPILSLTHQNVSRAMYTPNDSSLNVWKMAFQLSDTNGCCSQVMMTMPAAYKTHASN
jgi:hypothetical protein